MKLQSLKVNIILNAFRNCCTLLFPLITFPYISKILSPEGLGKVNYSSSIAIYFILIAGLGIQTYAVREGSRIRDNKKKFNDFANEIFSLNIISTILSYLILLGMLIFVEQFENYRILILIYSSEMIFRSIGVEWLYSINENYTYITIRSFIFQLLSVISLFVFVKSSADVYNYVAISVFASAGSSILNLYYSRKYCKLRFIINKNVLIHLKPAVIIFSATVATTIYINSGTTMLGIISGDKEVGYFSVATKMYNILKSVINSIVVVFSARLSYYFSQNKADYYELFNKAFEIVIFFSVPIAMGGLIVSEEIIYVISGKDYLSASTSMTILLASIIFASLGNLWVIGALLPLRKENIMFLATSMGAVLNVIMNAILIPKLGNTGAALSTFATEFIIFIILFWAVTQNIKLTLDYRHVILCVIASTPFILIKIIIIHFFNSVYIQLGLIIGISAIIYFGILLLLKDRIVINMIDQIKAKLNNIRFEKNK